METIKNFFKEHFNRKVLLSYLYGEFASRFLGFIVGMWAVSLIGHFFEYPSFKNLWGLNSHKTMVSKATFEELKWIVQVVIGFFVFEIVHKTVFAKVSERAPEYYKKGKKYLDDKGITEKAQELKTKTVEQIKEKAAAGKEKIRELYNRN